MLLKPALCRLEIRTDALDFAPEPVRMIHVQDMAKLVQNDVVLNARRRLNEPPIQRDRPASGTGAPTRSLVTDRNATNSELMSCGKFQYARRKFIRRQLPEMPLGRRTQITCRIGDANGLAAKSDYSSLAIDSRLKRDDLAAKQDFGTDRPFLWPVWTGGKALKLFFQPFGVPVSKALRFCN